MFYDTSCFPFTEKLEEKWEQVLAEYQNLKSGTIPYPETDLYRGEWDVLPFIFFGEIYTETCKRCPNTWALLEKIPGLRNASFSILRQATEIAPHTGFTTKVLRCHLGLEIPHGCAIIVGDVPSRWEEGKALVFDDTVEHYAYNKSEKDRVVLIIDVDKEKYEGTYRASRRTSNKVDPNPKLAL
jgi:aspartyl/asparaginyl beta-hydroxylase (cupin superfamily)